MIAFEAFQTVPLVALRDMDPYMQIGGNGKDFPTPGEEFHFVRLDLSRALIRNPGATFFIQLTEEAMSGAGMQSGDILVVDREMDPRDKCIIVAFLEGEFILRRLRIGEEGYQLVSEHDDYPPIDVEPDMEFSIWGVVRDTLHREVLAD